MTTERIDIVVREDGSRVVNRNLRSIGDSSDAASNSLRMMQGILSTLIAGGVITGLVRMADTYTNIQNKLRLVTTGTENLAAVTKKLQVIANETRTDFESTAELYARLSSSSKELGVSQDQMLKFTKTLNQAIVLSGASASEAAGGLRQLAQGMASGALRGDELNSVMENFPKVADIIAQGLGVTRGELRKLGADGKITAKDIIEAFQKAEQAINEDFATTIPTVSQSLTVFRNNFMAWIGNVDQSLGITRSLAELILTLGNNMDIIIPILAGLGVAIATAFAPALIVQFTTAIKGLWLVMAANPFIAVAAIIAGLVTTLYAMRDAIKLGIDDTTTLGDLMRAVWESIGPMIKEVGRIASDVFGFITSELSSSVALWTGMSAQTSQDQAMSWTGFGRKVVQVFDIIGATVRAVMTGIGRTIAFIVSESINRFRQLGEVASKALSGDFAGSLAAAQQAGKDSVKVFSEIGSIWGSSFKESFDSQISGGLEATFNKLVQRAQEIGKERAKAGGGSGVLGGGGGGSPAQAPDADGSAAKRAAKELDQLKSALRGVMDAADPAGAATRQLAEDQETLNRAVKANLITSGQAKTIYEQLADATFDQREPLAALNREMDRNIQLLGMSSQQREIEAALYRETEQLKRSGVTLTQMETEALRAKIVVEQELLRISQARESIEANSMAGQFKAAQEMIAGMQSAEGLTGTDRYNVLDQLLGGSLEDANSRFVAQQEQFANYYAIIEEFRQADIRNEQAASDARRQIQQMELESKLDFASGLFGQLSVLMQTNSKKAFKIGQAAAIAEAMVNTYKGVSGAIANAYQLPFPINIAAAAIGSAAAIAGGIAQVSKIRAQQPPAFRTGGSMVIGGNGGTDSQMVSFRGTPGEVVSVNTPTQAGAMSRVERMVAAQQNARPTVNMNLTVVQQGRPDNRTPEHNAREMRKQLERTLGD